MNTYKSYITMFNVPDLNGIIHIKETWNDKLLSKMVEDGIILDYIIDDIGVLATIKG
jgi:hypothetical protein